jgi:hypothetical protein
MNKRLPDFLIIGTPRGGTYSLFSYLAYHPQIEPPKNIRNRPGQQKELHFFNRKYNKGISWYTDRFPETENKLLFEATPDYLYEPNSPSRIKNHMPKCKIIILLRNPVSRTWSLYYNYWRKRRKTKLNDLYGLLQTVTDNMEELPDLIGNDARLIHSGIYIRSIKRWFSFFPKKQFLILKSEDLFKNTMGILNECFDFLGVNKKTYKPRFLGVYDLLKDSTSKNPTMPKLLEDEMAEFYKPYNQELYEFLGRDFRWEKNKGGNKI